MKYLVICTLILAGALFSGCSGIQVRLPSVPAPARVPVATIPFQEEPPGWLSLSGIAILMIRADTGF
jgi:hypothetical protein